MASADLFQRWRVANDAAMTAAKAMFDKSILALDGKGDPPSRAEAEEVRRLRGVANELFDAAMARMLEAGGNKAGARRCVPPPSPGPMPA